MWKVFVIVALFGAIQEVFASNYRSYYEWQAIKQNFVSVPVELPSNASSLQEGFFTKIADEPWTGASQAKQDILVRDIFQGMKNGYFLDIAANDWFEMSNTYRLERYLNWTGICAEPNPKYHVGLLANRKCHVFTNPVGASDNESIPFRFLEVYSGFIGEDLSDNNDKVVAQHQQKELPTPNVEIPTTR